MADKFIQMAQRNAGNTDWDNLYPQDKFETAGGTATAITLTIPNLVDGISKTFIASAGNNSAATTINGVNLYKPNTTTAPTLITGKAYTVWYNVTSNCFFIKASAEGDATVADVLAGKVFSNGEEVGLVGNATIESLGGKKWASGTGITDSTNTAAVTSLNFKPSVLILISDQIFGNSRYTEYVMFKSPIGSYYTYTFNDNYPVIHSGADVTFTSNGFSHNFEANVSGESTNVNYSWMAIE